VQPWGCVAGVLQVDFSSSQLMSNSALLTMYDAALLPNEANEPNNRRILDAMEETSTRITAFSVHLFADPEKIAIETQSPLVPYSQFQAAVVQYRLWKGNGQAGYKDNLDALKRILVYMSKRWRVAGIIILPRLL
jgi:hypothetical protein